MKQEPRGESFEEPPLPVSLEPRVRNVATMYGSNLVLLRLSYVEVITIEFLLDPTVLV